MREPFPSEEYITIINNKGREKVQRVEFVARDVRGEDVYVTADGLAYAEDSLEAKDFQYLIGELDRIPTILSHPDIVVHDHMSPEDTLIYYRRIRIVSLAIHQLIAVVVKIRRGIKLIVRSFLRANPRFGCQKASYCQVSAQICFRNTLLGSSIAGSRSVPCGGVHI